MSRYLLPPYKAYVKTDSKKIVLTSRIEKTEIHDNELYVVWEDTYYGTIAIFKERVIATADTKEELLNGENELPKKRPFRY